MGVGLSVKLRGMNWQSCGLSHFLVGQWYIDLSLDGTFDTLCLLGIKDIIKDVENVIIK